ncbi:hypothetical protein ACFFUP_17880 [Vibrio ostreicida]|uniref:YdhG-like domain-containing protein n=1 Tax=Vibrio ostreicida TaxID=526588 RepID=A0ABT8BWL3_9VIBR|nr:hypothetical protein [Vibrio ostreicida]MDN3611388.1 hypothetical protein [Vibrio ostreicida]NPD09322.1 hypothetical protein [Vibrio ostreicida]
MNTIKVSYDKLLDDNQIKSCVDHITRYSDACDIIDQYPWTQEVDRFGESGESGGLYFILGDEKTKFASFLISPTEYKAGYLDIEIVAKRHFLNIFGFHSAQASLDSVKIPEIKRRLKDLFDCSIEELYKKYRK